MGISSARTTPRPWPNGFPAEALHFNNEYGLHEQARDEAVAAAFGEAGLGLARGRYDWDAVARLMRRHIEAAL